MFCKNSENIQKRSLDPQLRNRIFGCKLVQTDPVFPKEDRANPKKFLLYFRKSRVLRSEKRRKGKLVF